MRVVVTGAGRGAGRSAVRALVGNGHDVVAEAATPAEVEALARLGVTPARLPQSDVPALTALLDGCDAVCLFADGAAPVGLHAAWPGAWRDHDRLLTEGVRQLVAAAREAGVRRLVHASTSLLYADQGEGWVTEESPLGINAATEPASVAESHVEQARSGSRQAVVLRFGIVVGDDERTRWTLRSAAHGVPVASGSPDGWMHLVHTDDVGDAVVAALTAPSGVYNVGAEPVRRREYAGGVAEAAGRRSVALLGQLQRRLASSRAEPASRSLRVCSEHFTATTGWFTRRASFDPSWFDASEEASKAYRD